MWFNGFMNKTLRPNPTSSRQFNWNGETDTYSAEMSELGGFGRVYEDACDEGLTIVSALTGTEVVFAVDHTETRDGEVVAWHLVPVTPVGTGRTVKVVVWND